MHLTASFVTLALSTTFASAAVLDAATFANTSFDFIVAGGGTAGTVVATRLAEISNFTVGIIEAGEYKPEDDKINVPMGWDTGPTWGDPEYDWMYYTKPQKNLANRMINIVRGKVLGGSSALNLMGVFLAGAPEYDQLTTLGNEGWDYNSTSTYFKKATNISAAPQSLINGEHATYNPKDHGTSGPIHISFSHWFSSAIPPFYNALVNLGIAPTYDAANGQDSGDVWCPPLGIRQDTGHRSYAAVEYYGPNAAKSNLHLLPFSQVTKIELSNTKDKNGNYRATGVTYVSNNQTYTAKVNKDVIVSGGAINSPQILELSGIGNSDLLKTVGIDTKIDLPAVGENYRDHMLNYMGFTVDPSIMTWDWLADPTKNDSLWQSYQQNMSGPYDSSVSAITYLTATDVIGNKTLQSQWLQELDEQFNATNPSQGERKMYEIERARLLPNTTEASIELYAAPSNPYPQYTEANQSYIQIASVVAHPFSRGSIHINTSDPTAHPDIDLNAWTLDIDKHLFVAAAKYSRKVAATAPLNETITGYGYPGANVTTDDEWEQYLAENVRTPFHPCCTVSMLPQEDGGAVSNKLMVYGTSNLRVVDASVFPSQFATHLSGTVYAFAEHAADIVKAAYGH